MHGGWRHPRFSRMQSLRMCRVHFPYPSSLKFPDLPELFEIFLYFALPGTARELNLSLYELNSRTGPPFNSLVDPTP